MIAKLIRQIKAVWFNTFPLRMNKTYIHAENRANASISKLLAENILANEGIRILQKRLPRKKKEIDWKKLSDKLFNGPDAVRDISQHNIVERMG